MAPRTAILRKSAVLEYFLRNVPLRTHLMTLYNGPFTEWQARSIAATETVSALTIQRQMLSEGC